MSFLHTKIGAWQLVFPFSRQISNARVLSNYEIINKRKITTCCGNFEIDYRIIRCLTTPQMIIEQHFTWSKWGSGEVGCRHKTTCLRVSRQHWWMTRTPPSPSLRPLSNQEAVRKRSRHSRRTGVCGSALSPWTKSPNCWGSCRDVTRNTKTGTGQVACGPFDNTCLMFALRVSPANKTDLCPTEPTWFWGDVWGSTVRLQCFSRADSVCHVRHFYFNYRLHYKSKNWNNMYAAAFLV